MHGELGEMWRPEWFGQTEARRLRAADPAASRVIALVARAFGIKVSTMLDPSRRAAASRARQVAIYLIHVCLKRTIVDAARVFGRDRSTGSYACMVVEERREDSAFDAFMSRLEEQVLARREKRA